MTNTHVVLLMLVLTSCATASPQQVYWFNPKVDAQLQQARFTLDSTDCTALAKQQISEPTEPAPNAFEAGRQRAQRERARNEYAFACLANRGWEQRKVGGGS